MLIVGAEVDGELVDVRCEDGIVSACGQGLSPLAGEELLQARGGALLPGLHDHHIHLYAQAAASDSINCGPPEVEDAEVLAEALGGRSGEGWLRGVGYHESVAGELDRYRLDRWVKDRPLRIQHRSGKMWYLNSRAIELLQLDDANAPQGIERGGDGKASGRLFRMDDWLRARLARQSAPDLGPLSLQLASWGVTGVTDASASNTAGDMQHFCELVAEGNILQRVLLMGDEQLGESCHPLVGRGALKILLDDHQLPDYAVLLARIEEAHRQGRGVAIHCVTHTELVFALTVLGEAGSLPVDRIEHASVTSDEALPLLKASGVTVVTQPGFIYGRGDRYRVDVPSGEQDYLYRCGSLLASDIPLAGSSDAPYGSPDPWLAMRAAVARRTREGVLMGESEQLTPEQALALFTGDPRNPGSCPRRIVRGAIADLCLLDRPWQESRQCLDSGNVIATMRAGDLIYKAAGQD